MLELHFFRARIIGWINTFRHSVGSISPSELLYGTIFTAATRELGLKLPALYPTKAAANYSLLYLVLRIATEAGVSRAIEIGAGQSTLLLNALPIHTETIETDAVWAARMQQRVASPVHRRRLIEKRLGNSRVTGFDEPVEGQFDFLIVDGPGGGSNTPEPVRMAALELLDNLTDNFVAVFDDANRPGVQKVVRAFLTARPNSQLSWVFGQKVQCVVAAPLLGFVRHF